MRKGALSLAERPATPKPQSSYRLVSVPEHRITEFVAADSTVQTHSVSGSVSLALVPKRPPEEGRLKH